MRSCAAPHSNTIGRTYNVGTMARRDRLRVTCRRRDGHCAGQLHTEKRRRDPCVCKGRELSGPWRDEIEGYSNVSEPPKAASRPEY